MTLRSGLTYSDGTPVKASDFTHAIERSIKISWGGSSFFTGYIAGAGDYGSGKATDISGIVTDDTHRQDHDHAVAGLRRVRQHPGVHVGRSDPVHRRR